MTTRYTCTCQKCNGLFGTSLANLKVGRYMAHNPLPAPGTTPQENFEWLLRFRDVKVPQMTLVELDGVLDHVQHLARMAIADPEMRFKKWKVGASKLREDLISYQQWLAGAIRELTTCGITIVHISVPVDPKQKPFPAQMSFEIARSKYQAHHPHPVLFVLEGNPDEVFRAFEFRVMSVLQACADRIGLCARTASATRTACEKVFLKTQINKHFCSKPCRDSERVRQWRIKQKKDHKKRTGLVKSKQAQQKGRIRGKKK